MSKAPNKKKKVTINIKDFSIGRLYAVLAIIFLITLLFTVSNQQGDQEVARMISERPIGRLSQCVDKTLQRLGVSFRLKNPCRRSLTGINGCPHGAIFFIRGGIKIDTLSTARGSVIKISRADKLPVATLKAIRECQTG